MANSPSDKSLIAGKIVCQNCYREPPMPFEKATLCARCWWRWVIGARS